MKTLNTLLLALSVTALSSIALAGDGLVVSKAKLTAEVRADLAGQISKEREKNPERFAALAKVVAQMPEVEEKSRARVPSLVRPMKALGKEAFFPLVELVAFDASPPGLSEKARRGLEMSAIEALGVLRDPRALPVLVASVRAPGKDAWTRRVAVEAIGTLGSDAARDALLTLAGEKDADPVLTGMGECRREKIAQHLRAVLLAKPSAASARAAATGLGAVGNEMAWLTPSAQEHADEEAATRENAMQGLVLAFTNFDGAVRREASVGLRVVKAKGTREALLKARAGASDDLKAAIDELLPRFAQ